MNILGERNLSVIYMIHIRDVYEVPLFLSKDGIHSELNDFLESIQNNQLYGFRKLYNTNKEKFFVIINEMVLRGFKFTINNNLFPKINFDSSDYIVSKNPDDINFKKIDFELLGIGAFIKDFNIKYDSFFDNIPLEGFMYFNPKIDKMYLQKLFKNAGFEIKKNNICEKKENQNKQNDAEYFYISDYYIETKFNLFRIFCLKNNYFFMDELSFDIIYSLKNERGFGEKKILNILEIYQDWLMNEKKQYTKDLKIQNFDFSKYNLKIQSLFSESKYIKFVQYCNNQNIEFVSDLDSTVLFDFSKQHGVGKKKIEEVWQVLTRLQSNYDNSNDIFILDDNVYDELVLLDLSLNEYFDLFKINSKISEDLYLSDINNKKYVDLSHYCYLESLHLLERYLNDYKKIEIIFNNVIDDYIASEKDTYRVVLIDRIESGTTLEQVAEKLNLTRERVRQIANKILKKINIELDKAMFFSYLQLLFWDKQIIEREDFEKKFPKHYSILISIIKEEKTNLFWNRKFDFFSFSDIELQDPPLLNKQREYYLAKEVIADCLDYWGEVISGLDDVKVREILNRIYGYYDYGEILSKHKLTKTKAIEILLRYYLKDGIKLDDSGCDIVRKLTFEKFGINLYLDSARNIETKARNNENLILVDSKKFKYFKETPNILHLINKLERFIDGYFNIYNQIDSKILYSQFKDISAENEMLNEFGLYSLVKKYCQDKYTFAKGNEKCIYKSLTDRISRDEQLKSIFSSNRMVMTKQEITEKILWPLSKLENVIANSKSFFCGSVSKIYYCDYIDLNENEIMLLNQYYKKCQENDYCHLGKLFYELKFDPVFNKILKKYNIENGTDLGVLVKYINGVRVWYNIAFSIKSEKKNLLDILASKFPNIVYRNEIVEYLKENKYDDRQIAFAFSSIDSKNIFVNIDRECLVNSNEFSIDQSAVMSLLEYIGDKEYVLLSSLRGYRKHLPKINYKWTPILMAEILSKNGYKIISKYNKDYRYDYSIVVKESSEIETLADLVYMILINEYEGSHDIQTIVSYMNERKVFYNKVLPVEIVRDDRFYLDEFNVLHWRY